MIYGVFYCLWESEVFRNFQGMFRNVVPNGRHKQSDVRGIGCKCRALTFLRVGGAARSSVRHWEAWRGLSQDRKCG